ncbi:MAG: DUF2235 domain-containing protein, partial [Deltaproteobacteria bacterium]
MKRTTVRSTRCLISSASGIPWARSPSAGRSATFIESIPATEVWFSGCHTNIGGGYVDANLSNIALFWMLQSARDAGLPLDARGIPGFDLKDPRGLQRDSYKEFYDS